MTNTPHTARTPVLRQTARLVELFTSLRAGGSPCGIARAHTAGPTDPMRHSADDPQVVFVPEQPSAADVTVHTRAENSGFVFWWMTRQDFDRHYTVLVHPDQTLA